VSINDYGSVAFVKSVNGEQGIFVAHGAAPPEPITEGLLSPSISFGPTLQINNHNQVIARHEDTSTPPRKQSLRVWDGNPGARDAYTQQIANSNGAIFDQPGTPTFQTVNSAASVNNRGEVVYSAFEGGTTQATVLEHDIYRYITVGGFPQFRPMIADDGSIAVRAGQSAIRWFYNGFYEDIACSSSCIHSGFTQVGQSPGISDSGRIIAFTGSKSGGPSPGVFASIRSGGAVRLVPRGRAGNTGTCTAQELDLSASGGMSCFREFEMNSRVGVSHVQGASGHSFIVAFIGTPNAASSATPPMFSAEKGLWTVRVDIDDTKPLADPSAVFIHAPQKVAQLHDPNIAGGSISNIGVYDPIANIGMGAPVPGAHQIAFWAETGTGNIVVRATKRPA
jgi:hypothetical protein